MSISWLLYAVGIASLLALAGHAAEMLLRLRGLPARFAWVGAVLGSLALPVVVPRLPAPASEPTAFLPASFVIPVDVITVLEAAPFWTASRIIVAVWIALSAVLLAIGIFANARLGRAARGWPSADVDDSSVLVSADTGPAVIGIIRPRIVLPEWALDLAPEERRLVLLHEMEHVRARDPWLLLFGAFALVVAPWNFALWYQFARLRRAVEVDCDGRLLRHGVAVRPYATLLLDVVERVSGPMLPVAAFAERKSLLEMRIRAMTARVPRYRSARTVLWAIATVGLVVVACEAPIPGEPLRKDDASDSKAVVPTDDAMPEPVFTPYTVAPTLTNQAEVVRAMTRNYPPLLRDAGIGGTVLFWVYIDTEGTVQHFRLKDGSGHPALDDAAGKVMRVMKFTAALNRGAPVAVWVEIPIQFKAGSTGAPGSNTSATTSPDAADPATRRVNVQAPSAARVEQPSTTGTEPTFTPYTTGPTLANQVEIVKAMTREYPPLLRDAGISGTVEVWAQVDPTGKLVATRMKGSSGHVALDEAGLRVAQQMKFTPALNHGTPVTVWISLPIQFRTQ